MDRGPAAWASPANLSKKPILGSYFRPSESEILEVKLTAIFFSFRGAPAAYGSSQARSPIGATDACLTLKPQQHQI